MLLVEIGADMNAFGSAERLASWVGICPGNHESAGKRKSGRIRRGNPWVQRLLCEFAQAAARTRCGLKAKFDALRVRKGYKKAIIALAHKMLRIVYAVLRNRTCYQDNTIDLRSLDRRQKCPALAENASQTRLHHRSRHGVNGPLQGQTNRFS